MRGATATQPDAQDRFMISIHAPHARSDGAGPRAGAAHYHFNPRSSCEERRINVTYTAQELAFQSTLLMRGATANNELSQAVNVISIHAPHARSDLTISAMRSGREPFQSTLLMRGATSAILSLCSHHVLFQSTLLMRGATPGENLVKLERMISIHAPHARSDHSTRAMGNCKQNFNPRSSCEERRLESGVPSSEI